MAVTAQTRRPAHTPYSAPPTRQAPTVNKSPHWLDFLILSAVLLFFLELIVVVGRIAIDNRVEKAIQKHAADGLARADYAAASWGATVVDHSEPRYERDWPWLGWWSTWWNGVHHKAIHMLSPSFGEPGRCFPLKGRSGFVVVKLREPIVPEAITIEHVLDSVVDDRSDAPKDCRVTAWLQHDRYDGKKNEFVLAEFSYDVRKSNVQTCGVSGSVAKARDEAIVNMVELQFGSNNGSPVSTCIYRLRVHGHKPRS
ncbi:putative SUN domain-containing protein [Rosa chinensis]|uniref:Putative SUN domain-containing protein n=2 Tax=Rosa chinensis TaxID=74649 RepID=A0A2P6RMH6_ROSCH|nr:putative SUN domain-containing protein [Rosa chinensis]